MTNHEIFLQAILQMKVVQVSTQTNEKGIIDRECIPFDFGPSKKYKNGIPMYHFYDLNSPDGSHNLAVLPERLLTIKTLDKTFKPADYVTWSPTSWYVKRDWGQYS